MSYVTPNVRGASATSASSNFDVAAPKGRVWTALTAEIGTWWPAALRSGGSSSRFTFEARLDGRLVEEWGNGAGQIWYRVVAIDPGTMLSLAGCASPKFGGPTVHQLHFELADAGSGTRISIHDAVLHPQRADVARTTTEGWCLQIGDALRRHLEARK